ncbi:MAG: NAD-dependent protein deacetylase [Trueperaceae bacterium]
MSQQVDELATLLHGRRTLVLSGAGISTESGIPDYRSPERTARRHKPMTYQQFVGDDASRRRYWARSMIGWGAMDRARPNSGHTALAQMAALGALAGLITQNVDGLHQKAGSGEVLELHGSLASIYCLGCRVLTPRREIQRRLLELNPHLEDAAAVTAPDGDAHLAEHLIERVVIPDCRCCGGVLKPDVVFFGENVPKERVVRCERLLDGSDVLLVVGSSLTVMSGMRWTLAAQRQQKPLAIINDGPTRADATCALKIEGRLGQVLPALASQLSEANRAACPCSSAEIWPPSGR